jgi:anti-anti-sigma regulatory factor
MSMRIQVGNDIEPVVVEFKDQIDSDSWNECVEAYNRIPRIWWKAVVIVLRNLTAVDENELRLLLYLRRRASQGDLWVLDCAPEVTRLLEVSGLTRQFNLVRVENRPDPSTRKGRGALCRPAQAASPAPAPIAPSEGIGARRSRC